MSQIWVNARVKLGTDVKGQFTKAGAPMATVFGYSDIQGENTFPMSVLAFGDLADELNRYSKNDTISITGLLKANDWTGADGTEHKGYTVVIDGLAGAKRLNPIKPSGKPQKKQNHPKPNLPPKQQAIASQNALYGRLHTERIEHSEPTADELAPFNDEINF